MTTPPPEPESVPVLHIALGPLDLNLLGLRVPRNPVVLDIDDLPAPGSLLGNLLAAVAGLLDAAAFGALLGDLLDTLVAGLTRVLEGIGRGAGGAAGPGAVPVLP